MILFMLDDDPHPNIPWTQNTEYNPNKALRCVTIAQILRFALSLRLMLVANVYRGSIDSQGCRWFGFDDGFGKMDGYKKQTEGDFIFEPFAYARIIGESEHHGDKKLLKIFHIEPVYEAHEIFHHLLHTIVDTSAYEKGPPPPYRRVLSSPSSPTLLEPPTSQEPTNHILANSFQEMPFSNDSNVRTSQNQINISHSEDKLLPDTAPRLQLSILQANIIASILALQVKAGGSMGTGVHVKFVIQEIISHHPNITISEFSAATEQLLSEYIVYNTIDDEHYACRSTRRRLSSENPHLDH